MAMGNALEVGDLVEFPLPVEPAPHDGSGPPAEPPGWHQLQLWKVIDLEPEHGACTIERDGQGEPDGMGIRPLVLVRRWVFVDEVRKVEIPSHLRAFRY
jgi:hypothetical protein